MKSLNRMNQDKGFTLIEVLLVLSVVSLLATVPVMQFTQLKKETETQLFFEQLRSSITLIQSEAILNHQWTSMEVYPSNRLILFEVEGAENTSHPANHVLHLPESISLLGKSKVYSFSAGSGNLGNINELNFETIHGRKTLSFKMGSGRFEIN